MKVVLLINSSCEAKYIAKQIEEIKDICTIIIEMKYKSKIEKFFRKIIGTSNYYAIKSFLGALKSMRRMKIYLIEKKYKKIGLNTIKECAQKPFRCNDIICVDNINSTFTVSKLKRVSPDLFIVFGTSIIKEELLNMFPDQLINIHFSVLPYYRGSIAEFWQFYNNELEKVGVTLHLIDNKIDTGPIICQKRTELTSEDNYITARYKNIISAENLIKDNLEDILNKKFRATVQDSPVSDTPYKFSMITEKLRYNYWHKAGKL